MMEVRKSGILRTIPLMLIVVLFCPFVYGKVIYVDDDATGANDGTNWANAYMYLQDALADANTAEKPVEIRVAQGVYTPDSNSVVPNGTGDREATFQLISGVMIKGGFAGVIDTAPNERSVEAHETILSGDLSGNDVEVADPCDLRTEPTRAENSYHVVTGSDKGVLVVLDGFTITAGNANGDRTSPNSHGGGVYNYNSSQTLINCTFKVNSAARLGGGMYNQKSNQSLRNCSFSFNSAECGGGIANSKSNPTVTNCAFSGNSANEGGGMYNNNNSKPILTNCIFSRNEADQYGGGMYNKDSSSRLIKCIFNDNSAEWGGGVMYHGMTEVTLTNCTFSGNSAKEGGGMCNSGPNPTITNCVFSGNSASDSGGGMWNRGIVTLTNCTFSGNLATGPLGKSGAGGGIDNIGSVKLTNCILWGNSADQPGTDQYEGSVLATALVTFSCMQDDNPNDMQIPFGGMENSNIDDDPLFVDAHGPDGVIGTLDDNLRLSPGSPCIDAGDDEADTDAQTSTRLRLIYVDLDANLRFADDPQTPDTGNGTSPIVDMGAFEFGSSRIQPMLLVDCDATGANNGTAWADAFTDLIIALRTASAAAGAVSEIWVAKGLYAPDTDGIADPREATFQLINGVAIMGGYVGFGEPDPNVRDSNVHQTILSGDLNGDDVDVNDPQELQDEPTRGENIYHVVTGSGTDETAVLDGFTVIGGYANGFWDHLTGGGMVNIGGSPMLKNCTFIGNSAERPGGCMYNESGSPTLTNCRFAGNSAGHLADGGGMHNHRSSPTLTNCTFTNNYAIKGGGMYNILTSGTITACTFTGNSASIGGGVFNELSNPTLRDCIFTGNSPNGMDNYRDSNASLINCSFTANLGCGISNMSSSPTLTNCVFSQNSPSWGAGMHNYRSSPILTHCTFSGNSAEGHGGGMNNLDSSPTLTDCAFIGNSAKWDAGCGGGMFNSNSSPTLTNCTFSENSAGSGGGMYNGGMYNGGMYNGMTEVTLTNCTFSGNLAAMVGGGIDNSFMVGSGIDNGGSTLKLTNCTLSWNSAQAGGGIYSTTNLALTNCILWGNSYDGGTDESAQIDTTFSIGTLVVSYCCIQGWVGSLGDVGNINVEPLFANPDNGDYHLKSRTGRWDPSSQSWIQDKVTSPCIDAGDPGTLVGLEPFPNGGIINMGAYGGTSEASKSP